jgi:hypothetical protein
MSVSAATASSRVWALKALPPRVEKPRRSSTSGDCGSGAKERRGSRPTRREAYRFDTAGVSAWNGPSLNPAYAAQVIGQTLPHKPCGAYPSTSRIPPALLLDTSL